jgi:uncharacterized protein YdaU (DUF1376 family)
VHYYQHHIGDFIKATSCLSNDQMVSYLRLLWMYYDSERPLEDDPEVLALRVGAKVEDVRLILRAYFRLDGGVWRQARCDREIEEYHAICERNVRNGKLGGRPKKKPSRFPLGSQSVPSGNPDATQSEPNGNPVVTLSSNHKPVSIKPPISPKGGDEDFSQFWDCWPANERKQDKAKCYAKWRKEGLGQHLEVILRDVSAKKQTQKWRDGFVEAPMVYLNNRRWEDSASGESSGVSKNSEQYAAMHRESSWWREAGFESVWDAMASRCWHDNADQFREGKRIKEAA